MTFSYIRMVTWVALLSLVISSTGQAQTGHNERLVKHLDKLWETANAKHGTARLVAIGKLSELELLAGREVNARKCRLTILGLMTEASEEDMQTRNIGSAAVIRTHLASGSVDDALRTLNHYQPDERVTGSRLEIVAHIAQMGDYERSRRVAREIQPDPNDRINGYLAIANAMVQHGQAAQAKDFLDNVTDLLAIHVKLPVYTQLAINMFQQDQRDQALATLHPIYDEVNNSAIPRTRLTMLVDIADAYAQVGEAEFAQQLIAYVVPLMNEENLDDYSRNRIKIKIAHVHLKSNASDQLRQSLNTYPKDNNLVPIVRELVREDVYAGRIAQAKQLLQTTNHEGYIKLDEILVEYHLERGDLDAAIVALTEIDSFRQSRVRLIYEIAKTMNERNQLAAFDQWASQLAAKQNDPNANAHLEVESREMELWMGTSSAAPYIHELHLGAVEGLLAQKQ